MNSLGRSLAPARDHMRPFRLIELVTGAAFSVSVAPFAGQPALADLIETVPIEAWEWRFVCRADDTATGSAFRDERGWVSGACTRNRRDGARTRLSDRDGDAGLYHDTAGARTRNRTAASRIRQAASRRLIAEARGAGLPFAGIFSAYRPPAFGIGGFVDKFHSLHTYGLAVDVTGIGAPGTASVLLWHEIAARHGVICAVRTHDNLVEWNHCQPTWVKIILPDNPLRDTVTADGPISLEGTFEVGYSLIAASGTVSASTADPPAHFFKQSQARTAMSLDPGDENHE